MTFSGSWSWAFSGGSASAQLKNAIAADLTRRLGFNCTVKTLALGSLIVDYEANVAANDPVLRSNLALASANTSWLTSTLVVVTAAGQPASLLSSVSFADVLPPKKSTCGGGCVAGIVIGSVAFAAIVIIGLYFVGRSSANAGTTTTAPAGPFDQQKQV